MAYVELRRHTMRVKPGQHLSQAGVDLARCVGESIGPFNRVYTSTIPRAFETAIAMGFAVDEQLDQISMMPDGLENEIAWDAGFVAFARVSRSGVMLAEYVRQQAALITQIAQVLPPEGAALVVSHGGIVEAQTVGCLPNLDYSHWGAACDYCEGARLYFDGDKFVRGEVLRVSQE